MKYVALLRGINPTNPNMRNERLRGVFRTLGFEDVETVISSGNVLFESSEKDAKALEAAIEEAIQRQLGFVSTTIIRSQRRLLQLVDSDPFAGLEDLPTSRLNITFLKKRQDPSLRFPYEQESGDFTLLAMHGSDVASVLDRTRASTSDLMAWLDKQFGKEITIRTWKTVGKILNRLDSARL